jgi:hypothetical protein
LAVLLLLFPEDRIRIVRLLFVSIPGGIMYALGQDYALVTRYIRNLRGGSQPILVQASDDLFYVAKFTNNLQGPNLPFNESAGSELYRACNLPVPSWKPLLITDEFIDQNPGCWMHTPEGRLRPEPGLCFGSLFLGGDGSRLLEILPGSSFSRVRNHADFWLAWLIDICAAHVDNRQAVFAEDAQGWLNAYFVDHGHLFGGPKGEQRMHFLASRYIDLRIYQNVPSQLLQHCQTVAATLNVDQLWRKIQTLPEEWKTASALDGLTQCLNSLSNPRLLQGAIESMVDADEQFNERTCREYGRRRQLPMAVLRAGLQAADREHGVFGHAIAYPACA